MSTQAGETTDLGTLELGRGVTIRGKVVDDDDAPIAGAIVRRKVKGLGDNALFAPLIRGPGQRAAADGSFELEHVAPGRFNLIATADGFARGESERFRTKAGDVLEGVRIRLGAGGTVEGQLLLAEGASVEDWAIFPESHSYGATRLVRPEPDGSFRIEALDPGRYNISAFDMTMAPSLAERFIDGRDMAGMVRDMIGGVVLQICTIRAGEVTEVVLDARGRAADAARIRGTVTIGGQPLGEGWVETQRVSGQRTMLPMALVDDGKFVVPGARPGDYVLQVRRGIFMAPVGTAQSVTVAPGAPADVTLELPGGSIAGRVVSDASGEPLQGAVVRLASADQRGGADPVGFGFEVTDNTGSFAFLGLTDGDYTLIADEHLSTASESARAGGRLEGLRLAPGESLDGLLLRARPAAGVSVLVTDENGSPLPRVTVVAVDRRGHSIGTLPLAFTDRAGQAHITGLPAGETRVVARVDGFAPHYSDAIYVSPGADSTLALTLRRGERVRVVVVDADGKRYPDAVVSIRPDDGPWIAGGMLSPRPRDDGSIDLGRLEHGPHEFAVAHPALGEFVARRTVSNGHDATPIELRAP